MAEAAAPDPARDFAGLINAATDGWVHAMGIVVTAASADEVCCELEVDARHHQGYGIVHGGVHAGIVETLASIGAAMYAMPRGQSVVGLENHTSFMRAVRSGKLHARATPLTRGRRSQVWEGSIWDEQDRLVATGRVRLISLERGTELAGEQIRTPLDLPSSQENPTPD
jgi:uncharacterized protein (TIGR00369 family)